jgi:N-acetylmuramoyl-L-alanine amidase
MTFQPQKIRLIRWIVVHHAGAHDWKTGKPIYQTMEQVRTFHMLPITRGGKGFTDIGYHRFIEQTGRIRFGRPEWKMGAHVHEFNPYTLGVCCSGDADLEPFNDKQLGSLVQQCAAWCLQYQLRFDNVIGHRETQDHGGPQVFKSCPGRLTDMNKIRELVRSVLQSTTPPPPPVVV